MITLTEIKSNPDLVEALDGLFDFSLSGADQSSNWIKLKPPVPFHVIAKDGAGGVFLAYGEGPNESLPILHATSEGQAGRVASNLTEWLGILTSIPYWRDLLKFSGGGNLEEMRETATFMEEEYEEDYPDIPEARELILSELDIPELADPIQILHANVQATGCTLVAKDGSAWESLFNRFTSDDNPSWV